MANPFPMLRNPTVVAVMDDLHGQPVNVGAVQRHLDFVRAQIIENNAIYADAAAQLPEARRRLAEALFAAAARQAPPETDEEELHELAAALAARISELAPRFLQMLQEDEDAVVRLEVADPEVGALTADFLGIAVLVERSRQDNQILLQAHKFLVVIRAVAYAITRAHLLPGILLAVAAAYALAYAVSGGAVVPGPASLMWISALVLCFLFGVPVVGNLA